MDWILFFHTSTFQYYFWNGVYPINVTDKGTPWNKDAEVTDEEVNAITSVIGNRKRSFSIKGRGTFHIVDKGTMLKE